MKLRFKLALALAAVLAFGLVLGWNRFHQPGWVRGGIGFIGNTSGHVIVRDERNQIQWLEGGIVRRWTGKQRTESETVYFDGHKVHHFSWGRAISRKGAVIRFLPHRIEVFDLEHLDGEYYAPRNEAPHE
jgi:hypothetical protein